jgi:sodium transport system permease protein
MTTAASRASIVAAKYLTVTTLGGVAGLLNVFAMLLTMRGIVAPIMGGDEDARFLAAMPVAAVPVMLVCAILLAGLLGAGMLLLASFARTFREGQTLVTPLYMAAILPVIFLATPGVHLTLPLALLPVANLALVVREAINGVFRPVETAVSIVVTVAGIGLFLALARFVLAFEDVVVGSYSGSLVSLLRERARRRDATRPGVS